MPSSLISKELAERGGFNSRPDRSRTCTDFRETSQRALTIFSFGKVWVPLLRIARFSSKWPVPVYARRLEFGTAFDAHRTLDSRICRPLEGIAQHYILSRLAISTVLDPNPAPRCLCENCEAGFVSLGTLRVRKRH